MNGPVLLYGATGYTGRDIACHLADSVDLVLAGRDAARVEAIAEPLGLPWCSFDLADAATVRAGVKDCALVVNAAGPFDQTAIPLVDACIATGVHYTDLTGEWPVFCAIMARDTAAQDAGVMLVPGIGLTVAASDCLLARAVELWPDTVRLCLGISRAQIISRGSVASAAALLDANALILRDGALTEVPAGSLARAFDYGGGLSESVAMSWADVVTGGFTTGVANIEAYSEMRWYERASYRASGLGMALTGAGPWRATGGMLSRLWPEQPRADDRRDARFIMVAEALDRWRRVRRLRLHTLDGYGTSVLTAAEAVRRILGGSAPLGFQTPARAFGSGFVVDARAGWFEPLIGRSAA